MYKCPNCGGEMEFLPENGKIKCEYCGSVFSPEEDLKNSRKSAQEYNEPQDSDELHGSEEYADGNGYRKVFICSQCGAALMTGEDTGVTFCSYCGSQAFLESRVKGSDGVDPDLLIPFSISKEQCQEIYRNKIRSAWFLPKGMKSDTDIDKFRGIYMPCWVYGGEAEADGDYTSVKTTRQGSYDIIKSYSVSVTGKGTYAGFVRDATSSFPDGIMQEIAPFDMSKAVKFNDRYMTGFYADIGNVPNKVYDEDIHQQLDSCIKKDLSGVREMREYGVTSSEINSNTNVKVRINDVRKGFFPVWFLSNKNDRTGLMSYAVVNGRTGKIHADLPIDTGKYLLAALLIAIPAFILFQFFTLKPGVLLLITMLLLGVMMFFSTKMIRDAFIQEHGLDDEGLLYLQETQKPGQQKGGYKTQTKGKMNRKLRNILLGIFCFIGLPLISAIVSYCININIIVWGFIAGIVLFVVMITDFSSSVEKDSSFGVKKKIKLPFYMIIRSIIFPLIGIAAGLIVTVASPARDLYYYLAAILCCLMLILTVFDFARSTNRLSLRKPAQLGKRGGDEDE